MSLKEQSGVGSLRPEREALSGACALLRASHGAHILGVKKRARLAWTRPRLRE